MTKKRNSKHKRSSRTTNKASTKRKLKKSDIRQVVIEVSDDLAPSYHPEVEAMIIEGVTHFRRRRFEAAKAVFEAVIAREPRARDAYMNLALVHILLGEDEAGEAMLEETIERFPRYVLPRANLAQIYLRRDEPEKAEAVMPAPEKARKMTSADFQQYALTWSDIFAYYMDFDGALVWLRILNQVMPSILPRYLGRRIRLWVSKLLLIGISEEEKEVFLQEKRKAWRNDDEET